MGLFNMPNPLGLVVGVSAGTILLEGKLISLQIF